MTSLKLRPALSAAVAGLAATLLLALGLASQARAATAGPNAAVLSTPAPTAPHPFLENWTRAADAATARLAAADVYGRDIFVFIQNGDQICEIATDPVSRGSGGGGCTTFDAFNEHGIIGISWGGENEPPKPSWVHGAVPDGVSSVQVHGPGETTRKISIKNNVFLAPHADATSVTFAGPSGPVRVNVAITPKRGTAAKGKPKAANCRQKANGRTKSDCRQNKHAHRKGSKQRAAR